MATPTPNVSLDKPAIDEENWGTPIQDNIDKLDYYLGETIAGGADPNPGGTPKYGYKNQILLDANNEVWICVSTDLVDPPTTPNMWVKLGTLTIAPTLAQRNIWSAAQGAEWETVVPSAGNVQLTMNQLYIEVTASVALTFLAPIAGSGDGEYDAATMQDQGQLILCRVNHPASHAISLGAGITYLGGATDLPYSPSGNVSLYGFIKQPGGNLWYATALLGYI